jgi:dienelactone hydrolase
MTRFGRWMLFLLLAYASHALAQTGQSVVDIPTRPGVTQRMVVLAPPAPKAAVILFAGGHGGLRIFPNGSFRWGEGNFLVRTRQQFAQQGLLVVVVDAPSDRLSAPYLSGFRQRPEHAEDIKAVLGWIRRQADVPVWLVGTSRGTQSAAYVATQLTGPGGPDGLVLSSSILVDDNSRPVPAMPLDTLQIPVLVIHHEQDACGPCPYDKVSLLMQKLAPLRKTQLLTFKGGISQGDACEAQAYHGFNGLENEVVAQTAGWILSM